MKYTRYQYKRRKSNRLLPLLIILLLIFALYMLFEVFKSYNGTQKYSSQNANYKIVTYNYIYCSENKDKSALETEKSKLDAYGNTFIVNENGENKIYMGIYLSDDECNKAISTLNKNNFKVKKVSLKFTEKDLCDYEIAEMLNASSEVLNKFSDKKVKTIKSEQLKKWTSNLKNVPKSSNNYSQNDKLKKYINTLPNEIDKSKLNEYYNSIYKFMEILGQN